MKSNNIFTGKYRHVVLGICLGIGIVLFLALYNLLASGGQKDDEDDPYKTQAYGHNSKPDTTDIVGDYFFHVPKNTKEEHTDEAIPDNQHEEEVNLRDVANDEGEDVEAEMSGSGAPPASAIKTPAPQQAAAPATTPASKQDQTTTTSTKQQPQRRPQESRIHPTIERLEN